MTDFIAAQDSALLARYGLNGFDELWAVKLDVVDEPNTGRGGWSSVCRLELEGCGFYLKRQSNYLTRNLRHPFGEPTLAREFRNIQRYTMLSIPTLQPAFFAERNASGQRLAVLMTRALDGWNDLDHWLVRWPDVHASEREAILRACGALVRCLHQAGMMHGCFYPKHIFLRSADGGFDARLIDLEKTRSLFWGRRDRIKDLDPLLRRASAWSKDEVEIFLSAYLAGENEVSLWCRYLDARRRDKEARWCS